MDRQPAPIDLQRAPHGDPATRLLEAVPGLLLFIVGASLYGALHGFCIGVVCPEMFTHVLPEIFGPLEPRVAGIAFGVGNSWWAGALVALPVLCAARLGSQRVVATAQLLRGLGVLLLVTACAALVCGWIGWLLRDFGSAWFRPFLEREVPKSAHGTFIAAAASVNAAFVVGFVGGLFLAVWTLVTRRKLDRAAVSTAF